MTKDAILTQRLLQSLSTHLSGRPECRQLVYRIAIGCKDDDQNVQLDLADDNIEQRIFFYPNVSVFPNRHDRKPNSKIPVLSHVLLTHFRDDVVESTDDFGNILIHPGALLTGVYEYQLSVNKRKRRWVRVS